MAKNTKTKSVAAENAEEVRYDADVLWRHEKLRPYRALLEAITGAEQLYTVDEALALVNGYLSKEVR